MIKVDLITGFLGAGKTTFLLKYARYLMRQGLKIGILEYDYGSINVDMMLLNELRCSKCELEMVAAACDSDCLNRRFVTKLISMAMSGYDRVIIEPSGVFDMDMFFDVLRDEPLEKWYEIGSVITIVPANLSMQSEEESEFIMASQAASAGCILLSRIQLCDNDKIEQTKQQIWRTARKFGCRQFEPAYIEKNWDDLKDDDYLKLANCGYKVADYMKYTAGKASDFSSVNLLEHNLSLEKLRTRAQKLFLDKTYGQVVRVKGFVLDQGKNHLINITEYEENITECGVGASVIVVIGSKLDEKKIKELLLL